MNVDKFDVLLHWMREREAVRLKKEAGAERPWTTDPIIAEWRFCNVNRCDDRETKWIFKHIIEAHEASPVLWFNLAIARFVNWSPTLAKLGYFDQWEPERFKTVMSALKDQKAYTGAYMVPAGPSGVEKHVYLADEVFTKLWKLTTPADSTSCAWWSVLLRRVPLMGDFLRNQIITDMRYTHHLRDASDWETFILAGPGTQRGLNRLHDKPLAQKWDQGAAATALHELRVKVIEHAPAFRETLRDINNLANCLCEFDKYCRVLQGEGKPRSRYVPTV